MSIPTALAPAFTLDFEGQKVRFVGTAEEPAWIAQDVCDVLGIASASDATRDFDADEKGTVTNRTLGGKQTLLTVYESGLYKLIFKSRKPAAQKFRKWVMGEVLPSIRKHGVYPPPESAAYEITLKPYTARIMWALQVRQRLPKGYWCVFLEGAELLVNAEYIFNVGELEMQQYDLLDGSVGAHWPKFRLDKPWMGLRRKYDYTFPKPDPRGTVQPWCYPMQELQHFKAWLHEVYWPIHFPAYVERKWGAAQFQRTLPIFTSLGVPLLGRSSHN